MLTMLHKLGRYTVRPKKKKKWLPLDLTKKIGTNLLLSNNLSADKKLFNQC